MDAAGKVYRVCNATQSLCRNAVSCTVRQLRQQWVWFILSLVLFVDSAITSLRSRRVCEKSQCNALGVLGEFEGHQQLRVEFGASSN